MERGPRCQFWLPKKKRFCANAPLHDSSFCGNHTERSNHQWIPCPIDPSHSVLQDNLENHLSRCPFVKQAQSLSLKPYYQKGINAGREDDDEEGETAKESSTATTTTTTTSEMKRHAVYHKTVPQFFDLIRKIKIIHATICNDVQDSFIIPEACAFWTSRQVDRKIPFQEKHVLQQASILGNLEKFGMLEKPAASTAHGDDVPAVVEFGAGRGYLTQMLADCYGIKQVLLVERKSYKLKADRSLRQIESLTLKRLRIDIEDLNLNAVEALQGVTYLAIGKHLCGSATDMTLKCCILQQCVRDHADQLKTGCSLRGLAIATCCHHLCQWKHYINKNYMSNLGFTKEDFHAITWFTSWAVDADHGSDLYGIDGSRNLKLMKGKRKREREKKLERERDRPSGGMDDSCAVCAETLEWVAYGACGHKDVCSTCVVRLRFICDDRRCCICKTVSDAIFVTKALGDYTRTINDFSALPSESKEGRLGSYWYHEDTQAFFDDVDHYKMIKAMCRLSCSVCDKMEEHPVDGPRRRPRFRNIEQLKAHLFHQHRLVMCSLCLEGRKVFICEQKLYTRAQLNQHISSGDSEVDGSESERGGFTGHPICEFCRTPFYGDNELYSHMSTEHYTCHICQRQHPGQYEYYKNYDDLEIHFRRDHFLCEDEACLAKKFIVFQSEAELKRHNTLEHGGRMSRSKRSAALQLPTSFRYRRSNEQDNRRGRGRTFQRDTSENDLSMAIQASLEASNLVSRLPEPSSSIARSASASGETSDADPLISPFESLATTDSEQQSARYREALGQNSRDAPLEESSFPPLPMAPGSSQSKSQRNASLKKTMASHQWGKNIKNSSFPSSSTGKPVANHSHVPLAISPQRGWPASNALSGLTSDSGLNKLAADDRHAFSSYSNPIPGRPASGHDSSSASYSSSSHNQHIWPTLKNSSVSTSISGPSKPATENGPSLTTYSSSVLARPAISNESSSGLNSSSKNRGGSGQISHSSSAPNLADSGSFNSSATDFPPVSARQVRKLPTASRVATNVEDIHTANKSLVERIRVALDFDQERFSAFKDISAEYRIGSIDAETYLVYVEQFGLSHLIVELARLCPDAHKQKELIETYNANRIVGFPRENGKDGAKGKEKLVDTGNSVLKDNLADSIMGTVRKLQSSYKPSEEVEVLSKDGYRAVKGKSKAAVDESLAELSSTGESTNLKGQSDLSVAGDKDGRNKQRKKTSKFHRMRLGDGSAAAILDLKNPNSDPDQDPDSNEEALGGQSNPTECLPVRGVWRSGGGQRLLAMTSRGPKK